MSPLTAGETEARGWGGAGPRKPGFGQWGRPRSPALCLLLRSSFQPDAGEGACGAVGASLMRELLAEAQARGRLMTGCREWWADSESCKSDE